MTSDPHNIEKAAPKAVENPSTLSESACRVKKCCDQLYPELYAEGLCPEANNIFANGGTEVDVQSIVAKLKSTATVFLDKAEKALGLGELTEEQHKDSRAVAGNFLRNLTDSLSACVTEDAPAEPEAPEQLSS
jgi:hypothetical protein